MTRDETDETDETCRDLQEAVRVLDVLNEYRPAVSVMAFALYLRRERRRAFLRGFSFAASGSLVGAVLSRWWC